MPQLLSIDASPFRVRRTRRVIRLATPLDPSLPHGVERAQTTVAEFADDFAPLIFPDAPGEDRPTGAS